MKIQKWMIAYDKETTIVFQRKYINDEKRKIPVTILVKLSKQFSSWSIQWIIRMMGVIVTFFIIVSYQIKEPMEKFFEVDLPISVWVSFSIKK